jgi:hypothetical protein
VGPRAGLDTGYRRNPIASAGNRTSIVRSSFNTKNVDLKSTPNFVGNIFILNTKKYKRTTGRLKFYASDFVFVVIYTTPKI